MKTQESFYPQASSLRPNTVGQMHGTYSSSFGLKKIEGSLINDPNNNLEGEMDALSKDDLKERLIVAEKVMKSLF
jgi:hypothetical protein